MLDCGYVQRDEVLAASAMPGLAASGRLDLLQTVLKLHSPLPVDNRSWAWYSIEAIKEACSGGKDVILRWLLDTPMGSEAVDRMRNEKEFAKLFLVAAEKGYTEVMITLFSHGLVEDFSRAMKCAVENGQVKSIQWLLDHYPVDGFKQEGVIDIAAEYGHVEFLQLFHDLDALTGEFEAVEAKRRKTNSWWSYPQNPIYWAAGNGHLPVLEWIQANRSQPWRAHAMDAAASGGHLKVVRWLHANRWESCTRVAMDHAASEGHLEVLKWLHANRSEGCSSRAMYWAAELGHLDVVKWLYVHRPDSRTRTHQAIDRAVRSGHVRVVRWLHRRFPDYKIGSDLEPHKSLVTVNTTSDCGRVFEMLLCLHACYAYAFTSRFLKTLREELSWTMRYDSYFFRDVKNWVDEHYPPQT